MAKLGEVPQLRYIRDGERYIVFLGDDRIGFVKKLAPSEWNAVDTFMDKTVNRASRDQAGLWLKREFERAVQRRKALVPNPQREEGRDAGR